MMTETSEFRFKAAQARRLADAPLDALTRSRLIGHAEALEAQAREIESTGPPSKTGSPSGADA